MNMSMQEYLEAREQRYDQLEDFAKYVANAVMREDFGDETFAELFCRRLYKLGYICKTDHEWALMNAVEKFPAADVEPVVYCRDCKWLDRWNECDCHNPRFGDGYANYPPPMVRDDFFCADGERRDGGAEG